MHDVRTTPAPKPTDPKTIYTAEDIRIQQYGDTAVVAFRLVATTENGGTKNVANLLNSGTFVKRDGKWQVVNWQSTRMPRTEAESKTEVTTANAATSRSNIVRRHRQTHRANRSHVRLDTRLDTNDTPTVIRRFACEESEVWEARSGEGEYFSLRRYSHRAR